MQNGCLCEQCTGVAGKYGCIHYSEEESASAMMGDIKRILGLDRFSDVQLMIDDIIIMIAKRQKEDPIWANKIKYGLVINSADLKNWRAMHKLTAEQAAINLCISIDTLRSMESGRSSISTNVQRMCQLLNQSKGFKNE